MRMENKQNEAPFEIYLENLAAYTAGGMKGEWIQLPQKEETLREIVAHIADQEEEVMISDVSVREDCGFMREIIGEWSNVYDLNLIAQLIGDEPHPAVQTYVEVNNTLDLEELANLFMQEDEIPFHPYEFENSDNPELMGRLSEDEKMGYTMIEKDPEIKAALENMQLGTSNAMSYIDVEAVGRDLFLSNYVYASEGGYYNMLEEGPDLDAYTLHEIRGKLAEKGPSMGQRQARAQQKERQRQPDSSPSM